MNNKTHFKMYKDGKKWAIMGISTAVLSGLMITGQQINAHADANNIQNTTQLVSSSTSSNVDVSDVNTPDQPSSSTTSTNSVKADTNLSDISQHQQLGIIPVHADGSIDTNAQEQAKLDPNSIHVEQGQDLIKGQPAFRLGTNATGNTDNHSKNYLWLEINPDRLTANNHTIRFTINDNNISGMNYGSQPITKIVMTYILDIDPETAHYYEIVDYEHTRINVAINFKFIRSFFDGYKQYTSSIDQNKYWNNWFSDHTNSQDPSHDIFWKPYVDPALASDFEELLKQVGPVLNQQTIGTYLANHPENKYLKEVDNAQKLHKHNVGITLFSNLSDGFYDEGIKDVTVSYAFYSNGKKINFKNNTAYLTVESLNHDKSYIPGKKDHIETVKVDSGARAMTLDESQGRIVKNADGNTLYAPVSNNSGQDQVRSDWDFEGSPNKYLGAGILNLQGDKLTLNFSMNPAGDDFWPSARFRFGSVAAKAPSTPSTPTPKPTPQPEPKLPNETTIPNDNVKKTNPIVPAKSQFNKDTTATETNQSQSQQLPQTGNEDNQAALGLTVAAASALLGLAGLRKKRY